jgi:hypothetical protein
VNGAPRGPCQLNVDSGRRRAAINETRIESAFRSSLWRCSPIDGPSCHQRAFSVRYPAASTVDAIARDHELLLGTSCAATCRVPNGSVATRVTLWILATRFAARGSRRARGCGRRILAQELRPRSCSISPDSRWKQRHRGRRSLRLGTGVDLEVADAAGELVLTRRASIDAAAHAAPDCPREVTVEVPASAQVGAYGSCACRVIGLDQLGASKRRGCTGFAGESRSTAGPARRRSAERPTCRSNAAGSRSSVQVAMMRLADTAFVHGSRRSVVSVDAARSARPARGSGNSPASACVGHASAQRTGSRPYVGDVWLAEGQQRSPGFQSCGRHDLAVTLRVRRLSRAGARATASCKGRESGFGRHARLRRLALAASAPEAAQAAAKIVRDESQDEGAHHLGKLSGAAEARTGAGQALSGRSGPDPGARLAQGLVARFGIVPESIAEWVRGAPRIAGAWTPDDTADRAWSAGSGRGHPALQRLREKDKGRGVLARVGSRSPPNRDTDRPDQDHGPVSNRGASRAPRSPSVALLLLPLNRLACRRASISTCRARAG